MEEEFSCSLFDKNKNKGWLKEVSVSSMDKVLELREQQRVLQKRIKEVEQMASKGLLNEKEQEALLKLKKEALTENEIEIDSQLKVDQQTFETGLKIIELLEKASKFMEIDGYELEKARLFKSMLSNLTLKDGSIGFSYEKPFDDLLSLTGVETGGDG